MIEVLEAIAKRVSDTPQLTNGLTGGFHTDTPPQDTPLPYVVMTLVSAAPEYTTGDDFVNPVAVQFSFFGTTLRQIRPLVKAYRDNFVAKDLAIADATLMVAIVTNEGSVYEPADQQQFACKHYFIEIEFTVDSAINP
jgi:hypothetical protein